VWSNVGKNTAGQIPLICGVIAEYHGPAPSGPELYTLMLKRIRMQGFFCADHLSRAGEFLAEVTPLVREGRIKWQEDIVPGIENAPRAFVRLFNGGNFGKLIVRVAS
jgi:NADPH-dependent curcumin reductase